jgi:hypothetical protein
MSGTDKYRASTRVEVVQVHQEFVNVPVRTYVNMERNDKRQQVEARVRHNQEVADLDMREQVRDVLFSAPYTGPVGTHRPDTSFASYLPSRSEVEFSVLHGSHEVRISGCKYGCKVMRTDEGREYVFHSAVYGHDVSSVEPVKRERVKVQHVAPKRVRIADSERENYRREREMRDLGFGARYGVHL